MLSVKGSESHTHARSGGCLNIKPTAQRSRYGHFVLPELSTWVTRGYWGIARIVQGADGSDIYTRCNSKPATAAHAIRTGSGTFQRNNTDMLTAQIRIVGRS